MVRSETRYILKAFSKTIILDKNKVNTKKNLMTWAKKCTLIRNYPAPSISGAKTIPKGKAGSMKIIFKKICKSSLIVYDKHHFPS